MEKKKIMIVEDEGLVALKIKKDVERMGYDVLNVFASGEEALEGIQAARPDLILMDIKLQGEMDGIGTADHISEKYDVPVIYLTAHSEEETLRRAKITGPYGFLLKPVNEKELRIALDITLYKHNLDCKLRNSEELYRLLAENMGDVIWIFNIVTGCFTFVSASVQRMRGFTPWQAMHQSMKETLSMESYELFIEGLRSRLDAFAAGDDYSTRIQTLYLDQVHQNGSLVPTEIVTTLMLNDEGRATELLGVSRDITERKQIEEELRMAHEQLEQRVLERTSELNRSNEQLRNLAAHLQYVREEERAKIAREIHDELGQALTAQKMELSWFRERYGDNKAICDKAGAMMDALNATIRAVKRICTELRPSILDDFGLVEAMQWQANEFQTRTRIECAVDSVPEDIEMDKERSTALFRIFQETLTNVLKHAGATKVTARMTKDKDNIILEVIDNGKGITDEQLSKPQSFGLIGMRERVYPWGGKVEITGHKNRGTKVKVSLPY
ncbi:MAG: response regulator [Dissulfurispiraceae bacterium]